MERDRAAAQREKAQAAKDRRHLVLSRDQANSLSLEIGDISRALSGIRALIINSTDSDWEDAAITAIESICLVHGLRADRLAARVGIGARYFRKDLEEIGGAHA